jgi:hypothetical protein
MASFGRLTVSGITGTNENTLALANINVDFSLLKIVPPKEFLDVGNSLSTFRKQEAEEGHIHQTARKLGAIFEPILRPTPRLLRSYGIRASQIAQSAVLSVPRTQGMFKKQSGVDGTSIWAAATSSSGAVQVHLLACMLARIWEQKDAISIWEELLKGRKVEIEQTFQSEGSVSVAACTSYLASLQTITRTHIGEWDDSARSWLRIADRNPTVIVRQNQLDQIVGKTRNMVNNRPSLYDSVIQAWAAALEGTERLLDGSPQQMQTGELLLGLNAWHIYPDINLLGDPDIFSEFDDPLVPKSGILTIGLIRNSEMSLSEGLHWSLPLAHLRYYGDPISRTGRLSGVRNRISLPEFMQTILGSLLGQWGVDESLTHEVLEWILLLHEKILLTIIPTFMSSVVKSNWLALLATTSRSFLKSEGDQKLLNKRLFHAGKLYGSKALLGKQKYPFFGLTQVLHFFYLIKEQEARIKFLRELMKSTLEYNEHLLIRYISKATGQEEFASVFPSPRRGATKRTHEGKLQCHGSYKRWIHRNKRSKEQTVFIKDTLMGTDKDNRNIEVMNELSTTPQITDAPSPKLSQAESRVQELEKLGETVLFVEDEPLKTLEKTNDIRIVWGIFDEMVYGREQWHWDPMFGEVKHFCHLFGDLSDVALFLRMSEPEPHIPDMIQFRALMDLFQSNDLDLDKFPYVFFDAVQSLGEHCVTSLRAIATMHQIYEPLPAVTLAIKLLELEYSLSQADWIPPSSSRTEIFDQSKQYQVTKRDSVDPKPRRMTDDIGSTSRSHFEEAYESSYFDSSASRMEGTQHLRRSIKRFKRPILANVMAPFKLSTAETFSCVLLSDSGVFNISPSNMDNVMAISSGDSLFIAAPLLSDPSIKQRGNHKIRHVMGNIGRAGTALLQAPNNPKIRKIGVEQWTYISGEDWDGQRRDAFRDTSLHLWFTGSSLPIDGRPTTLGEKDIELYMLESVVSVHGRGTSGCGEVSH